MPPRAEKGAKTVPGSSSTARRTGGGDSSLRGGSSSRGGRGGVTKSKARESRTSDIQRMLFLQYISYDNNSLSNLKIV